jgi:hypothetical protein
MIPLLLLLLLLLLFLSLSMLLLLLLLLLYTVAAVLQPARLQLAQGQQACMHPAQCSL